MTAEVKAHFGRVIGFTKTWNREFGPRGIRVNAVASGLAMTPMLEAIPERMRKDMPQRLPLKPWGLPEEIAHVYALLASDEASCINSAVIEVSGGLTV